LWWWWYAKSLQQMLSCLCQKRETLRMHDPCLFAVQGLVVPSYAIRSRLRKGSG